MAPCPRPTGLEPAPDPRTMNPEYETEDRAEIAFIPGLEKFPVPIAKVCYLDGHHAILEYRGYRIEDLARNASFEEISYLLLFGKLPAAAELDRFTRDLSRHRRLKFGIV